MSRSSLNQRVTRLEVKRRTRGDELHALTPEDPKDFAAFAENLSDRDIDELIGHLEALPHGEPPPELRRFMETDLTTLSDNELENFMRDLDAYRIGP